MLWSFATILFCFVLIWFTSDSIVKSIGRFSKRINLSQFSASFILLGLLTSVPEFSIGINSIIDGIPEVFVGNLLGGIIVLFCFVAPFLAILGKKIKVSHSISRRELIVVLLVTSVPGFIALRGVIDIYSSIIMIVLYLGLLVYIREKKSILERFKDLINPEYNPGNLYDILKICAGIVIIFVSGKFLVDAIEIISVQLQIPPYLIGLIGLSIGSNLPELFIGTISILKNQKDVAFGQYLGSAAANGFFLGLLVLINGKPVVISDPYFFIAPAYIVTGLSIFYFFIRKNNDISRYEGFALLGLYLSFVIIKIFIH